ncbi:MAG: hypothetical protein CMP39_00095 [Rickettsiales bacterium]|nr:hypothetical protein [Rickettsiales bacterium]
MIIKTSLRNKKKILYYAEKLLKKNMKILQFFLLLFFLFTSLTHAYSKIGLTGGVSMAGFTGDVIAQNYFSVANSTYHLEFNDNALGFDGGVRFEIGSDKLHLISECMFRFTGSYFSILETLQADNSTENGLLDLFYLYVPTLLQLKTSSGVYFEAGGYYSSLLFFQSYIINELNFFTLSHDYNIREDLLNGVDYGYILGFGIDKSFLSLGTRFSYSLADFFQDTYKEQKAFTTYYNISLTASLKF